MKTSLLSFLLLFTVLVSFSQPQWTYTNLTEPKCRMGATSLGTKVYFAGGDNEMDGFDLVEIYDVVDQTWTYGNLSAARSFPVSVSCGSKVFFAGGFSYPGMYVYDVIDIYDTVSQEWTVEHLSEPRFCMSAVSHNGKVLFAGGWQISPCEAKNVVDIYDVETGDWDTAYLSQARGWMSAVVLGDSAIFAGGFDYDAYSNVVDIYNFNDGTMTTTSLWEARGFLAAVAFENKMLIVSGMTIPYDPYSATSMIDIYDRNTGNWGWENFPHPRGFIDYAKTIGDKAYFAGGGNMYGGDCNGGGWEEGTNLIDIYDNSTGTWSVEYLSNDLVNHAVTSVVTAQTGYLVVAGGESWDPDEVLSKVEVYGDVLSATGESAVSSRQSAVRCYPNPTDGISHFTFLISQYEYVILKVYDVNGREVSVVVDEKMPPGEHTVSYDMSSLPSGIYFYRLTAIGQRLTASGKIVKY